MAKSFNKIKEKDNRILLITPEYSLGGAEAQLRYIIYELECRNKYVDVYVLHTHKQQVDMLLKKDSERFKYVEFSEFSFYHRSEYRVCREVERHIRSKVSYTYSVILIFHEWFLPLIPFFHEMGMTCIYSERLDAQMICKIQRYHNGIAECDILTSNSISAARCMEHEFHRNVRVIKNGKDIMKKLPYNRPDNIRKILIPCRLAPIKNLTVILDMLDNHPEREFEVRFVGEKEFKNYTERLEDRARSLQCGSNVTFVGYTTSMENEFEWADLVILPSLAEGTPNVILEAYGYGRPVIVSDIEAERDVVKEPRLRFSPNDIEALYDCICYVDNMNSYDFDNMLSANHELVKREYSISQMTDAFISIIDSADELKDEITKTSGYEACRMEIDYLLTEYEKKEQFYLLMYRWNVLLQRGYRLDTQLKKEGISSVAIYGFRELGELLYNELSDTDIDIRCVIDRNHNRFDLGDVRIIAPSEISEYQIDAIIVTAVSHYDEIKTSILESWNGRVISLEEIVV